MASTGFYDTRFIADDAITVGEIAAGALAASAEGRSIIATGFFDTATVNDKFAAASIALDRLEEGVIQADGGQAFTANQSMGSNKLTNLADGTDPNDAVNKGQLDAAVSGLTWKEPVKVTDFIGERTITEINALTPAIGDAVVATDAGTPSAGTSDALAAGDLAEYDGTSWKRIYDNAAGRLPNDVRLIVSTTSTLFSPLTDGVDDGKVLVSVSDPGSINGSVSDFNDTGDAVDGNAVLVQCPPGNTAPSVNENKGYVFDGTVPTGSWVQFAGAGQISAGDGLVQVGQVFNVGAGSGITVNTNDVAVNPDGVTGGNIQPVNVVANGVGLDIAAIAGTGLEADGAANLRISAAAAGDGLTGGGAAGALQVQAANGTIASTGSGISVVPSSLIQGGVGQINGNLLAVNQIPTNYTRSIAGDATALNQLAAHLQGIDDALGAVPAAQVQRQEAVTTENVSGSDTVLADTLDNTPVNNASVRGFLNGAFLEQGNYYSISTTSITWRALSSGFDLLNTDTLIFCYDS